MQEQILIAEKENELIKQTFADNESLLKAIRALFLGFEVSAEDKSIIKALFSNVELKKIMWKRFLPSLDKDAPINMMADVWLGVETMVFGQNEGTIYQAVQYKALAIEMTEKALKLLDNPDGEKVDVTYDPKLCISDKYQVKLLARNQFLRHVEGKLAEFSMIANKKEETKEQAKVRTNQNSAK